MRGMELSKSEGVMHTLSIFLLILALVRTFKRAPSHTLMPLLSFYSQGNGRTITFLLSSTEAWRPSYAANLKPLDISGIDEAVAETDLCKPLPTKLHLGKGGREIKRRHIWMPANLCRITVGKRGYAVANFTQKSSCTS